MTFLSAANPSKASKRSIRVVVFKRMEASYRDHEFD
jgi:hypothetical protein